MATTKASAKESGELSAMLLPELKKVAGQLGIEDATSMKKPDLVQAIGDLQAANREAAKAEREARRAERDARRKGGNKNSNNSNNNSSNNNQNDSDDGENQGSNPNDASDADVNKKEWTGGGNNRNDRKIVTTIVEIVVTAGIAITDSGIAEIAKSAKSLSQKMMFCCQLVAY
jgi:transcription termination factor Rho